MGQLIVCWILLGNIYGHGDCVTWDPFFACPKPLAPRWTFTSSRMSMLNAFAIDGTDGLPNAWRDAAQLQEPQRFEAHHGGVPPVQSLVVR